MSLDKRVDQYVRLRDKIKELNEAHEKVVKPMKDALATLNGMILQELNKVGGDSVKTPYGTAYRKMKHTASIADGDAFRRYVIGGEQWDLLDWKANVTAVTAWIKENHEPPPGVNYSTIIDVGVRRGATKDD